MWSIQQVATSAGVTSRTLRHYDAVGLLRPSAVGDNGYRWYDDDALVRLQRILLLRDLGLGLPAIAEVLAREGAAPDALQRHLEWLRAEHERLERQMVSVQATLDRMKEGAALVADEMFDGFDHGEYRQEVDERWGSGTFSRSDEWWASLTPAGRAAFQTEQRQIAEAFAAARAAGEPADGEVAQALADRQVGWVGVAARAAGRAVTPEYVAGLGELYVADERFGRQYDRFGPDTAAYVRDALVAWAGER